MSKDKPRYRLLLDEGVPVSFGVYLRQARHNVEHIKLEAKTLMGKKDNVVLAYAVREKRILIATDADFSHRGSDLIQQVSNLGGAVVRILGSARPESLSLQKIWQRQAKNLPRYPKGIFVMSHDSCKKLA